MEAMYPGDADATTGSFVVLNPEGVEAVRALVDAWEASGKEPASEALEALAPISAAATTAATSPVGDLLKGEEPVAALNPMATQLALLAAAVGARGGGAVTEANVSGDATEVKTEAAGDANGDAVSAMDVAASSLRAAARECLEGIQVCVRRDRCGGAP